MKRIDFDTIDSTNEEAKRRIRAVDSDNLENIFGTVITARAQTAGKGRRGRDFHSPGTGDSVYLSFILLPPAQPEALQILTIAAAVAVCRTIEAVAGIDPGSAPGMTRTNEPSPFVSSPFVSRTNEPSPFVSPFVPTVRPTQQPTIKWVNDIMIDGKKVCGILAEGVPAMGSDRAELAAVVLGIGVNITVPPSDFPPELRETAGSLWLPEGGREGFVQLLCKSIFEGASGAAEDAYGIIEAYRHYENTTGRQILVTKYVDPGSVPGMTEDARPGMTSESRPDAIPAYAKAIADDGGLVVVYTDGSEETLRSGEVSVLL